MIGIWEMGLTEGGEAEKGLMRGYFRKMRVT